MRLVLTDRFRRAYRALPPGDRQRAQKALRLMGSDLRHPGLGVKRIRGTRGIWEARAGRALRITFEVEGGALVLRNVGPHDEALRNP